MLLPQTYVATLAVMLFGMLCLGCWANTFKLGGNWRFELYYFDFAFGVLIASLVLAFTAGSVGFDGFSFMDDLMHAGKRQWFYAFVAGVIFNFGNMLLMASITVAGMAVAFPIGIGCAVVVGALLGLILHGGGSPSQIAVGCAAIVAAIVADAIAYTSLGVLRHEALAKAGKAKSTRRPTAWKGILLPLVSGLLLGTFAPLVQNSMEGDVGLGPYSMSAVFGVAVFFSSFAFNMFFVNLAVDGDLVEIGDYFRARPKTHLLGLSGGVLWTVGATALVVGGTAAANANLGPALNYQISQGFAVIAALCGLLVWNEFRGSDVKIKFLLLVTLVLYAGGVVLISMPAAG